MIGEHIYVALSVSAHTPAGAIALLAAVRAVPVAAVAVAVAVAVRRAALLGGRLLLFLAAAGGGGEERMRPRGWSRQAVTAPLFEPRAATPGLLVASPAAAAGRARGNNCS